MSNAERIFDQVIRDARDLVARQHRPRTQLLRDRSLTELLDSLDDSKLPRLWTREPITRRRAKDRVR